MQIREAAVLGATGVTGKCLVRELLDRGTSVRVVSRSRARLETAYSGLPVEVHEADLRERESAKRAASGCEVLFHCVGVPLDQFEIHLPIARNVAAATESTGARAVLLSSYWSYGPARQNPVAETRAPQPKGRKEQIRHEQEEIFRKAGAAVTLLPDFYGPEAELGFLNPALRSLAAGKAAHWIGELDEPREFIYVPDAAFPIVELATREAAYGRRWNIAGSGTIRPRILLESAARLSGRKMKVRTVGRFVLSLLALVDGQIREVSDLYDLYTHPPILDAGKLRALIGDYPTTDYPEGIRKTIDWIRSEGST